MERHRCKLCFRNFANGRALGGHMRSHMMNFYAAKNASKQEQEEEEEQVPSDENIQEDDGLQSVHSYSSTSSSSSEEEEDSGEVKGLLSYELRENPKKSTLLVDPEFSFAAGSVVLQDGESETESSRNNPVCRRSKRVRKSRVFYSNRFSMKEFFQVKKSKFGKEGKSTSTNEQPPLVEPEPLSSISDTTPEEDVAYCLMMLSRDKWEKEEMEYQEEEGKKVGDDYSEDSGVVKVKKTKVRGKYRCETCSKLFRSYQALGGHRASHKKIKVNDAAPPEVEAAAAAMVVVVEEKIHECPFCHRVFSSGQALGGHKRSHFMGAAAISANVGTISPVKPFSRIGETLDIDLNLPAPTDDD
ncbi:hypothetical protein Pfo_005753 [Paulownia fortunei]|nr:hypothetical protein Pfo_005753 [Paulownia fortunei]